MRIAVIGDIHGNKYALESVLAHIESQNVDVIVSTGDLVGYLPYPNEVIDLMRKNKILVIQGNHDHFIATSQKVTQMEIDHMSVQDVQKNASAAFVNWIIRDDNRRYLKT